MYKSNFEASGLAMSVLTKGRILADEESPSEMVERVVGAIGESDFKYTQSLSKRDSFEQALGEALDEKAIIMSTPVLTNAGRYLERPLTACTVPTTALREGNQELLRQEITTLHEQGMGTGFNLDDLEDPVKMLRFLNDVAVESSLSGKEDRPVGNMAVLTVYHPQIRDFIAAKSDKSKPWKFNLSIDIDEQFMDALSSDKPVLLRDGTVTSSSALFDEICAAATNCGDPGLIFLDRMNNRNPVPSLGEYRTTAPCAEVGLLEGETCQFGYVNLAKFLMRDSTGATAIDQPKLESVSHLMTRVLDDTLDISRGQFASDRSRQILDSKRKVGIGICGVADALTLAGMPYDSQEGLRMIQDMLAIINYSSKEESIRLAEQRGSCLSMADLFNNRYLQPDSQIERLYANNPTTFVDREDWTQLAKVIKSTRLLRNITTVALPPTGRSALVIDASTGIEPHFTIDGVNETTKAAIEDLKQTKSPEHLKGILGVACNITPLGHIAMAASLQTFTDESLSKTINLPKGSSSQDVAEVYRVAHGAGMSGVTIYVDGTHEIQPKSLK